MHGCSFDKAVLHGKTLLNHTFLEPVTNSWEAIQETNLVVEIFNGQKLVKQRCFGSFNTQVYKLYYCVLSSVIWFTGISVLYIVYSL